MCQTTKKSALILIALISCPLKGANNNDEAWPSAVGSLVSSFQNLDVTGPDFKWNCADRFNRKSFPLVAVWIGDYREQVMVAQVSYCSCLMWEILKGAPMGHSSFWVRDDSTDQHGYSEHLDEPNIDNLCTLGVHPIWNQIWQYSLCNVYHLWQPDALHQLLLGSVEDLLHWLLNYLEAGDVKDQFDK